MASPRPWQRSAFRPALEPLEDRWCPAAPVISLSWEPVGASMVTLSGAVQDETPAGMWIMFSGRCFGMTTTDSSGAFSVTLKPSGSGQVMAQTFDAEGLSGVASVALANAVAAIVEFTAIRQESNCWTFSGRVQDESPAGLTVQFGGLPSLVGKTAQVQSDGTFSLTVQLQCGEEGAAYAQVSDWWNQMSAAATYMLEA